MASIDSDTYAAKENVISSHSTGPQSKQALLPLRIIYSINTPSQSLLARHKKKVDVYIVDDDNILVGGSYGFAKVSLKTCLGVVCGSSPELLADDTRDYSIYYADPLETADILSHVDTPGNHSSTISHKGVSVGVGLLSWWLSGSNEDRLLKGRPGDDDEGLVVGRVTNDRGTKTLEIIMSFKETPYKTQHEYAESMTYLGMPMTSVLSLTRAPSTRPSSPSPNLTLARSNSLSSRTDAISISRTGRPPGASTHPEKRARRMAIMSHRESLEKMKNIAMMQRNEPYDQAMVAPADLNLPPITDQDIARQSKILEDLEARPLIIDRSPTLLTSKPLQRRKSTTSNTITARDTRKQRSTSPTNAMASGSTKRDNPPKVADVPIPLTAESIKENQAVLSMLTTILSKVDSASLAGPSIEEAGKGKVKEQTTIDDALVNTLGQLLPLLSTFQSAKSQPVGVGVQSSSLTPTAAPFPLMGQWDPQRTAVSEQHSCPPIRLFPTTEETFYSQERSSYCPYDRHWVQPQTKGTVSQDPPKVSPDTHPVPGGGWARGKNLVPRSTLPDQASSATSKKDQAGAKCVIDLTQPDKENMPPSKTSRGLKRSSSLLGGDEKENRNEKPQEKNQGKRRKQGSSLGSADDSNKALTSKRTLAATGTNRGPGSQNCTILATSPIRPHMTGIDTMPVMAMSEPDFARPGPIIANSSFPDVIMGPPRTPPRRKEKDTAQDVEGSWVAPDPRTTPRAEERSTTFSSSLFTPSPVRSKIRVSHVASDMLKTASSPRRGQGSDTQSIKTGWDLPPSSPPPPTSPVSPLADVGWADDDAMPDESISEQVVNEPDGVADKNGKNISSGNDGMEIGTNAMAQEATILLGSSAPSSDFDPLLDADFKLGFLLDGEHGETAVQSELDFDELWKTLGPVLMQAQNDDDNNAESTNASAEEEQTGLHFFEMSDNDGGQTGDVQNDALRMAAEELKALFGGCVV